MGFCYQCLICILIELKINEIYNMKEKDFKKFMTFPMTVSPFSMTVSLLRFCIHDFVHIFL